MKYFCFRGSVSERNKKPSFKGKVEMTLADIRHAVGPVNQTLEDVSATLRPFREMFESPDPNPDYTVNVPQLVNSLEVVSRNISMEIVPEMKSSMKMARVLCLALVCFVVVGGSAYLQTHFGYIFMIGYLSILLCSFLFVFRPI